MKKKVSKIPMSCLAFVKTRDLLYPQSNWIVPGLDGYTGVCCASRG